MVLFWFSLKLNWNYKFWYVIFSFILKNFLWSGFKFKFIFLLILTIFFNNFYFYIFFQSFVILLTKQNWNIFYNIFFLLFHWQYKIFFDIFFSFLSSKKTDCQIHFSNKGQLIITTKILCPLLKKSWNEWKVTCNN